MRCPRGCPGPVLSPMPATAWHRPTRLAWPKPTASNCRAASAPFGGEHARTPGGRRGQACAHCARENPPEPVTPRPKVLEPWRALRDRLKHLHSIPGVGLWGRDFRILIAEHLRGAKMRCRACGPRRESRPSAKAPPLQVSLWVPNDVHGSQARRQPVPPGSVGSVLAFDGNGDMYVFGPPLPASAAHVRGGG